MPIDRNNEPYDESCGCSNCDNPLDVMASDLSPFCSNRWALRDQLSAKSGRLPTLM